MRRFALALIAIFSPAQLPAGLVELFGGEVAAGEVTLEYGGVLFKAANGAPVVKLDFTNLYRVQFSAHLADEYAPGVVLRNGVRLAAPVGALNAPNVQFPKRGISIPTGEIAWLVYQPFPTALAANATAGQTGALLPGGDFFSGTIRGADMEAAKVFNPIFGLRRLEARQRDLLAVVLRDARPLTAQYEIRTNDGSVFGVDNFGLERTGVLLRHPFYDNIMLAPAEVLEIRAGALRCRSLASLPQLHAEPIAGLQKQPDGTLVAETRTVITCAVPPGFTEFTVRVAPGDDLAPGQRVIFRVFGDGQGLVRSEPIGAGSPPQSLRVALNGARGLILRIEPLDPRAPAASGKWLQAFFLKR